MELFYDYASIMTNLRDKTFYKREAIPFVIFVLLEIYYFLRGHITIPLVCTVNRQGDRGDQGSISEIQEKMFLFFKPVR
jgi:hypothetical protein